MATIKVVDDVLDRASGCCRTQETFATNSELLKFFNDAQRESYCIARMQTQ